VFDDIGDIRETRKRYNHRMFQSGVPVFRAFEEAEAEALRSGAMDEPADAAVGLLPGAGRPRARRDRQRAEHGPVRRTQLLGGPPRPLTASRSLAENGGTGVGRNAGRGVGAGL
jgi:hypothetical protein